MRRGWRFFRGCAAVAVVGSVAAGGLAQADPPRPKDTPRLKGFDAAARERTQYDDGTGTGTFNGFQTRTIGRVSLADSNDSD